MTLASFAGCDSGLGVLTLVESDDGDLEFLTYKRQVHAWHGVDCDPGMVYRV